MTDYSISSEHDLLQKMTRDVQLTYRLLISSHYVTNRHIEQIVIDTKNKLKQYDGMPTWQLYLNYTERFFSASTINDWELHERRLTYFNDAMIDILIYLFSSLRKSEQEEYIDELISFTINHVREPHAPWAPLLFKLTDHLDQSQLEKIYTYFKESLTVSESSSSLIYSFSYIALCLEKEVTSLYLLLKADYAYSEQEVEAHFNLLAERKRWHTMKHWIYRLFPKKYDSDRFGSLQTYVDKMKIVLSNDPSEQDAIWNRWLRSPHYERFEELTKEFSIAEKSELIGRLLPELERNFHQDGTMKTYEKLLLIYEHEDYIQHYLLNYEEDPFRISEERGKLLELLKHKRPDLAKPVLHQFVLRLVEKKSRAHYEKAAHYLQSLQIIYTQKNERELFRVYMTKLQQTYRTYRAFIEELKHIDF